MQMCVYNSMFSQNDNHALRCRMLETDMHYCTGAHAQEWVSQRTLVQVFKVSVSCPHKRTIYDGEVGLLQEQASRPCSRCCYQFFLHAVFLNRWKKADEKYSRKRILWLSPCDIHSCRKRMLWLFCPGPKLVTMDNVTIILWHLLLKKTDIMTILPWFQGSQNICFQLY